MSNELKELVKDGPVTEVMTIVTRYTPGKGIKEDVVQRHVYNRELSQLELNMLCAGILWKDESDNQLKAKPGDFCQPAPPESTKTLDENFWGVVTSPNADQ